MPGKRFTRDDLKTAADLMTVMKGIEAKIKISDLNEIQKTVLFGARRVSTCDDVFDTTILKQHPLNEGIAHATFYRTIKELERKGIFASLGVRRQYRIIYDEVKAEI